MYQAWPWAGTAASAASPTTAYIQPAATGQVATTQWPAGYSQYAVTPEMQQQWAAWQAQYAYSSAVPVGQVPTTTSYSGGYPEYQTATNDTKELQTSQSNAQPIPEKPKNPTEELVPQDSSELEKLKQLKEQAQQWKTLQQPAAAAAAAAWSYSTAATGVTLNATTVTPSEDSLKSHVLTSANVAETNVTQSQMDKEEEEFERQFKEWEKQFEAWKEQNINHPDKEAFAQYEKQWQEWRAQLLQKKEQMQKAKAERLNAISGHTDGTVQSTAAVTASGVNIQTQASSTIAGDTTSVAATNPGVYYQPTQYMYMQPYVYPSTIPVAQPNVTQQYPYAPPAVPPSANSYNNHGQNVSTGNPSVPLQTSGENSNMNVKGMKDFEHNNRSSYKFDEPRKNPVRDESYQNYEGYENSNMYMPEMEEEYQMDWKYGPGSGSVGGPGSAIGAGPRGGPGGRSGPGGRGGPSSRGGPGDRGGPSGRGGPGGRGGAGPLLGPGSGPLLGPGSVPGPLRGPPSGPLRGPPSGPLLGPGSGSLLGPGSAPLLGPGSTPLLGPPSGPLPGPATGTLPGPGAGPLPGSGAGLLGPGPGRGRGRGNRGRGRARGRGRDRWSDNSEVEGRPGEMNQGQSFPDGPNDFPDGSQTFHDNSAPFPDGPGPFPDGHGPFPDGHGPFPEDHGSFPEERGPFPEERGPFPEDRGPFPKDRGPFPEGRVPFPDDHGQFPKNHGPFPEGRGPFTDGPGPFPDGPAEDGPPPFEYPTEDFGEEFPEKSPYPEDRTGGRRNFPPEEGFPFREGPQHYPPEDFDEAFPPSAPPPFDDRFPPEQERFQRGPPPMAEDGRFPGDRDYDHYPPVDDDRYGPPPFREEFPPFEERFPPNRGRFHGRGRRFPGRGEFDRFGPPPPFPPGMRDDGPYGPPPDFTPPPDERFGFLGEGPQRMPLPGRGMRPPFEPGFPGRGHFPDDRFYGDGPPSRYKSVDYTHRPASAVLGEDFNPHYEYESEFQDDVGQYRDNFSSALNLVPRAPIIFSQVSVESFDYGHGMKPMTSTTIQAKKNIKDNESASPVKVFDYSHHRERSPSRRDRSFNQERNGDRSSLSSRERERDSYRSRDRERNRDRERDIDKERERDRERKDSSRDNRDNRDRDRDNRDRDREKDREKDRERESKKDREWERDRRKENDEGEKRFKWDKNQENERSFSKDKVSSDSSQKKDVDVKTSESSGQFKAQTDIFKNESFTESTLIEDILIAPKRSNRPKQLVIILRGLPGSGKTYVAKLIKDKEIENGGSAPRILSLDDYFMVEAEVTDTDPDTGKRVKRKEFKFEYESGMEEAYRSSLFKSFKKTIDDRFFPFIIVDAVHDKSKHYEQYWSYAKQRGFQVYIAEMDCNDPVICHKRNIHNRSLEAITKILEGWETKPRHFMSIDVRSLLQDVAITEVEMEVESNEKKDVEEDKNENGSDNENEESNSFMFHVPSRWEKLEATEEKLDQLDGLRVGKKKHSSMEDYLQLPDDYEERKCEPGKKRVRWADLEEKKEQDRLRAIGFVVGQTDWTKLTDPTHADRALTKTKYF